MDAKDLRTDSAVSERNNDGSKYSQSGGIALHCDRNKSYQDIGSNSLGKVDVPNGRPCAVIGPDRVVPPPAASEAYHIKKGAAEPWPCMDNAYRRPPEYPHKLTSFQNPTRNISPRQTFQENMQRIMVPPTYNSIKINDDTNYAHISDRSNGLSKNIKLNMPPEAKFCDVPYGVNPNNEQKNVRNSEMCLPSVNPNLTRTASHGWPPGSVNLRSTRIYGAPELYQYQEYPSCAGPRPVVPRPHRNIPEEQGYVYADPYYQEGNIRFKPYPSVKERYPQQRYEYIGNYSNPFHPPPGFPPHKYELQKSLPPHPYPPYPPIKYLDSRVAEPVMEGYQRNSQGNFNIQYRNQVIHPNYGAVIGNCPQSKVHSYPPDAHIKTMPPNKLPYDNNAKAYIEYDNNRPKIYPPSDSYFVNEMGRMPMKSQVIMPNYSTLNMHNIPPNPYYKKDSQQLKNYDQMAHFRAMDPNLNIHNHLSRQAPIFSPNTLAISPTDSNTSNDTTQTLGTSQEDCGYVSQSSSASVRSMDSSINRIPNDYLRKYYDNRYGPIVRTSSMMTKPQLNTNNNISKDKKQIDVRQFLQMWNEGDEETEENNSKEIIIQTGSSEKNNFGKSHEAMNNSEQLYVLGLVNVPSEELAKYEHIQKVSKLPENIKGYNSIELLNQFEEVIESSNMSNYKQPKEYQMSTKGVLPKQVKGIIPPRPVSPLDVEAKISQSVIHKEVGCNFEIKPCSPKMLNVEVAAPIQNILAERSIEKVANPVMLKSPLLNPMDKNNDCNRMKRTDHHLNINENVRIPSCKMINTQFSNNNTIDPIKTSYSLQDLESNSGLCLASLPRLDNDIELNFPEVNQQFINANKGDNTVLTTPARDLPSLDVLDQSDRQIKEKIEKVIPHEPESNVNKSPHIVDSETEFSKLSKYRKTKTNPESKEIQIQNNVNALRTDSVIIKNPENNKNYEESLDYSSHSSSKSITDIQQVPINLTSQGLSNNTENEPDNIIHDTGNKNQEHVEIAIDFSLNKTAVLDNTQSMETKYKSQIKTPVHIDKPPSNTVLGRDDSSDSSSLLPGFSESPDNITKIEYRIEDRIVENRNSSPGCEIDSNDKLHEIIDSNTDDYKKDLNELPSFENSCIKTDIEITKCDSDINNTEDMIVNDRHKAVSSPLKTEMSGNEIMSDINEGDNFINENCDDKETPSDVFLEVAKNNNIETDSEIPNNHNDHYEDKYEMDATDSSTNGVVEADDFCENYLVGEFNCPNDTEEELDKENSKALSLNDLNHSTLAVAEQTLAHGNSTNEEINIDNLNSDSMHSNNQNANTEISDIQSSNSGQSDDQSSDSVQSDDPHYDHVNSDDQRPNSVQSGDKKYDSKQSDNQNSNSLQPQNIHKTLLGEYRQGDVGDEIEVNNMTQFIEEFSYYKRELPNLEDKYCGNTQNSPVKQDHCDIEMYVNEFACNQIDKSTRRYLQYGGKEMYSPRIQNLLMFTEGRSNNVTAKHYNDSNENCFVNSTKIMNTTESDNEYDNDRCDLGVPKAVSLEEIYSDEVLKEELKENNYIEKLKYVKGITETNTSTSISDTNMEEFEKYNNQNNYVQSEKSEKDLIEVSVSPSISITSVEKSNEQKISVDAVRSEELIEAIESSPVCEYGIEELEKSKDQNISIETVNSEEETMETSTSTSTSVTSIVEFEKLNEQIISVETVRSDGLTGTITSTPIFDSDIDKRNDQNISVKAVNSKEEIIEASTPRSISETSIDEFVNSNDYNISSDIINSIEQTNETNTTTAFSVYGIDEFVKSNNNYESDDNCTIKSGIGNNNEDELEPAMENIADVDCETASNRTPVDAGGLNENNIISLGSENSIHEDSNINEGQLDEDIECQNEALDTYISETTFCESIIDVPQTCNQQVVEDKKTVPQLSNIIEENARLSCDRITHKRSQPLKRSLSDSALNMFNNDDLTKENNEENVQFIWPFKRRKVNVDNDLLAQNLCNIIHNNRRNSISSFYNEENVSFCILINNGCIITEEENEEADKVYTELSEDCLAEIQDNCMKHDEDIETLTTVVSSSPPENGCDYSDSFALECEEQKTLEETWVEDVACIETVISDDIAEDIEISGRSSPKDDDSSDNDESGVFSSSDHTDKVKFIYGDKMCSDDAQFVETLYKTPQMDVNKTLYNRESNVSENLSEYDRYYDNDSLEKMLSESNEQNLSPYIPEYMDSMFPSVIENCKTTPENKENMNMETFPAFQSKSNALDIVVDINVDKSEHKDMHSIEIFANTRNESEHSCESSIDDVFTYNQKDEDTIYTSSSPEVSSTTSEEKSSGILLKITNYKGSRISQINDISRVKRSSCKFTEDKEYLQSHPNFSTNRPLLTKGAQKYIPPLKESIRDLKVKLSLPQHSLIKLKQLKLSKDEPKVNKQSATISRIPKKPKPKFEDVLKSIDEIQFKKHKEKTKKTKKSIPKVVIKKSQNGSHYASTSNKDDYNPDLTGRKWQPWVFIEKNHFIDKMAIKNKTRAIYSHRKKTYVLAEKFQKYKSASSAKFVITPPISDSPSSGLKYTIRLKHNY